jgi:lysophospholipase L1-like esterase
MTARTGLSRPWTLGEALRALGWLALLSCVALNEPIAAWLFAADARALTAAERSAIEPLRTALGIAGIALLATSSRPRWAGRDLFVLRGQVILATAAIALCLALAEVALRVRQWQRWGSGLATPLSLASLRPERESYHRPGRYAQRTLSDYDPQQAVMAFIEVNRYGLRGPLPELPKPAGRLRIVALGGSTTFAFVSDGLDWPSRLQGLLAAQGNVEVINAGRPGSTTWSDYRYLRDRLLRLEPDVLLLLEGFNDMWRGIKRHFGDDTDYGVVDEGLPGRQENLDLGPPQRWPLRISFGTYFAGRILDNYLDARAQTQLTQELPQSAQPLRFEPAIVAIYERNLGAMIRLAREHGVQPVLITFPGCDDASLPADEQRRRLKYVLDRNPEVDAATAQQGLDLYREATRGVAVQEKTLLVDAATRMTKDTAAYTDTVHLTPQGEEQLARAIAPELIHLLAERTGGKPAGPGVGR